MSVDSTQLSTLEYLQHTYTYINHHGDRILNELTQSSITKSRPIKTASSSPFRIHINVKSVTIPFVTESH